MKQIPHALFAVAALCVSSASVNAATLVANAADATWSLPRGAATYDAGVSGITNIVLQNNATTDTTLQVGGTSANTSIATAIIPFQIPTLAPGQTFANVIFSLGQSSASNGQQVDLYGLGARGTAAVAALDYYRGTTGGDTTDATLLQAAFVGTGDIFAANAVTSSSLAGSLALTTFLNSQHALGAAGQYVFLRLNVTDAFTTTNTRISPTASEFATATSRPTLTYNVVPEPASAILGIVGILGFLRRRRN